jgi:hypothetical protein
MPKYELINHCLYYLNRISYRCQPTKAPPISTSPKVSSNTPTPSSSPAQARNKSPKYLPLTQDSKANPQSNTYTEDILNTILPPREYTTEKQQLWYFPPYPGSNPCRPPQPPNKTSSTCSKNSTSGCSSVRPDKQGSVLSARNSTVSVSTNSSVRLPSIVLNVVFS